MLCNGYAGFEVAYLLQTKLEKKLQDLKIWTEQLWLLFRYK
jgi:hypothetical protein